ncbi:MAG: zinc-ribbon domain-containing protein [Deltaproteobacteria bacterium]|nr:zinc-ribbon domain-containing protein [Deltaproteobacteria bacterium]
MSLPRWAAPSFLGGVLLIAAYLIIRHGLGAALIVLAGATLLMFIWLAFRAVQSVTEPDDRVVMIDVPPTPAQSRKITALRALKDLEFEKSLGNLSEADYAEIEARYREEAKRAMREVDDERAAMRARAEEMARDAIERAAAAPANEEEEEEEAPPPPKKRRAKSAAPEKAETKDPTPTPAAAPASIRAREKIAICPDCATKNDPDARFCKQCGAKMEVAS